MYQPFITLWTGPDSLLGLESVCLFTFYFFVLRVRSIGVLFHDSAGLWEKDVLKSYLMIGIDLVIDLVLLQTIGINGAIISSIVSMVFAFIYEGIVVSKYCLNTSSKRYFFNTTLYLLSTVGSCALAFWLHSLIRFDNNVALLSFALLISIIISILVFYLTTFWTKESKDALLFAKGLIRRKKS